MKLARLLMMTLSLQVSVSINSQTVNFSGKDIPLIKIFSIITKQTGTLFFYEESFLQESKPVTVTLKKVTLETALNEIFKDQPLTWILEDKTVTISKRPVPANAPVEIGSQQPSPIEVRGKITDEYGNTITDVSVTVKGKKQGTIANSHGRFSIKAFQKDILVFSSVGYSTKEMKVQSAEMKVELQLDIKPMETYIMGGNLSALRRKADATSVTIIDSKTLEKIPVNTIDQVFRGLVPSTNSFDAGDGSTGIPLLTIRGAGGPNSFSAIAVYIDGIEYAGGSGFLCQLDKTNIDRIEVVRGPGASTMYGTGSNAGIVQIFTKKGKTDQLSVNINSGAGFYKSKWVEKNAFQQMHNLEMTAGFKKVVLTMGGTYRSVGPYLPDGGEKNKGAYLNAKFDFGKLQVNVMGRYNARNASVSRDPSFDTATHPRTDIIIEPFPGFTIPAYQWFSVQPGASRHKNELTETYIAGINLVHNTTAHWINKLEAGYTENNDYLLPVIDGITPLQRTYGALEFNTTTIRYSNTLTLPDNRKNFAAIILSGIEYKKYSSSYMFTRATAAATVLGKDPDNENYGAFVQVNPSYKNLYLTLGLRYEKNELFKAAWNPRIGLTTNFDSRSLTFKPRISWGKGITAPSYSDRFGSPANAFTVVYANPDIKPQGQQGFDYGLEVYEKKGRYKFEVVYYDNILKNMITQMVLGPDVNNPGVSAFISTNSAEVVNRGWEFSGDYHTKRISLRGTFSIINTTIEDTTGSYLLPQFKGYAPGTRMTQIPKHTAGLNFTYIFFKLFNRADRGSVSLNVTEVDGVRSFDHIRYYLDVAYGRTPYDPNSSIGYPVENSPVFRVGVYTDYQLTNNLRFFIQGSNILNSYKYEQSNNYPTHGATWLFGLKFNFTKDIN